MAFYTSRVDEDGNEIEKRQTSRSLTSSLCSTNSSNRLDLSSRSYEIKSSVRYVNPAAYIEKNADFSDAGKIQNEIDNKSISESQSDIVPPLDLKSDENYPTTRDYTFSYRKHCEAKIVLKPDRAYETWLSAKRKLLSDEAIKRKNAEKQKRKEAEDRKLLAEEKFKEWLENKGRLQKQQTAINPNDSSQSLKSTTSSELSNLTDKHTRIQLSEEEIQANIAEWERVKRLQDQQRRMQRREEELHRREIEYQRRQMSAEAWEKWLAEAAKKPKPVPLNRGIFTLRGTVSDIFINPNEWQPIIPIREED